MTVAGFGYWSGHDVQATFHPAPADHGIVFIRADRQPPQAIPACVYNRIEVPRRTSLAAGAITVEMVEHMLAALGGLQVDNCEIWVDAAEMPGCDGSSLPFVTALEAAGIVLQDRPRSRLIVEQPVRVGDEACWVQARPSPTGELIVECRLDYGADSGIGRQTFVTPVTPATFRRELAAARTFLLEQEAVWLRSQGLGGRVTCRDLLVFDAAGPIDNPLRFPNECARHKALDLVGDLTLAGCDLVGHFVTHCGGHRLNAELVQALLACARTVLGRRKTA